MQQAIVGVDPHKRVLSAVALDGRGGRLGQWQGSATSAGIRELWAWAGGCAPGAAWAIEGSNLYGRRLALALVAAGADVRDVCPTRTAERRRAAAAGTPFLLYFNHSLMHMPVLPWPTLRQGQPSSAATPPRCCPSDRWSATLPIAKPIEGEGSRYPGIAPVASIGCCVLGSPILSD